MVAEVKGMHFVYDSDLSRKFPEVTIEYKNGIIYKGLHVFAAGYHSC